MCHRGDRVKLHTLSSNIVSDESFIILNNTGVDDLLLPYTQYKLINISNCEILHEIKVWDHAGGLQYNLINEDHTLFSYIMSIIYILYFSCRESVPDVSS